MGRTFDATLAAHRFGAGIRSGQAVPTTLESFLNQINEAQRSPFLATAPSSMVIARQLHAHVLDLQEAKKSGTAASIKTSQSRLWTFSQDRYLTDANESIKQAVLSPHGFFERLAEFWTDHFTVSASVGSVKPFLGAYQNEAIRPHIAGSFMDMLRAVVLHPAMLIYLDQIRSIGPNSPRGKKSGLGLNENFARELLELHTLGVNGGYSQQDVRQLAELLTGLSVRLHLGGFVFKQNWVEPGDKTVFGKRYDGAANRRLDQITAALNDLANRPETANYVSFKLARHFVADNPPRPLVAALAKTFMATKGDLPSLYRALLEHKDAWTTGRQQKVRQPLNYIVAGLRAVECEAGLLSAGGGKSNAGGRTNPITFGGANRMMQRVWSAPGPNGWPQDSASWINPVGFARRYEWAHMIAGKFQHIDCSRIVEETLGHLASGKLRQAVHTLKYKPEGIRLVLCSPEFNLS